MAVGLIEDLANAIFRVESGNGNPASLAVRNNNPGNLRSWGSYPVVDGYVKFPDMATGMAALEQQVQKNISRGLNLYEFFGGKSGVYSGYAPAADANQPRLYAQTVAGWLGISPEAPLSSVGGSSAAPGAGSDNSASFQVPDIQSGGGDSGGLSPMVIAAIGVAALSLAWMVLR